MSISIIIDFVETILLPLFILVLAQSVLCFKNPVYSLLSLIGVFILTICYLLLLHVEFLSFIFLIVYIGAIAILFLFVIMMFNLHELVKGSARINVYSYSDFIYKIFKYSGYYILFIYCYQLLARLIIAIVFINKKAIIEAYLLQCDIPYFLASEYADILVISNDFYTTYFYIFIIESIVLLAAMIGAIVLALSTIESTAQLKPIKAFDKKSPYIQSVSYLSQLNFFFVRFVRKCREKIASID